MLTFSLAAKLMLFFLTAQESNGQPQKEAPVRVINRQLELRKTLGSALQEHGVSFDDVGLIEASLKAAAFDFRRVRPGEQFRLFFRGGLLTQVLWKKSPFSEWLLTRQADHFEVQKNLLTATTKVERVQLKVETSIWNAAKNAHENPEIAVTLSDVFAWDVDFYRDVQAGDVMTAVVEKTLLKGRTIGYGRVLAAEYIGHTVGKKRSFRFQLPDGSETFFTEDGQSARKTFLKSPLKFAQVTSGFGGRFHPVLHDFKTHNGVDYHAPVGTPVWAVADGTVASAGWDGGGGNVVCLKHPLSFETCYMHLSKIRVKAGQRIQQKNVIGDSGSTGRLTTGPHLHFGMRRGGRWVNPLNQHFPRAEPLAKEQLASFVASIEPLQRFLQNEFPIVNSN
jgi:murein DD-endopeptidase MepM/ murein hydrolase activator NlpD